MLVLRDGYLLGHSGVESLSGTMDAIRLDLSLEPNPFCNSAWLSGIVTDQSGKPVVGAAIILLDSGYNLIANTITDIYGKYSFSHIEPGFICHSYAKASEFALSKAFSFTPGPNQNIEIDFTLLPESSKTLSLITGKVQSIDELPLSQTIVELHKIEGTKNNFISLSFTNEVGQFIFRDVEEGVFIIKAGAPGYFPKFSPVNITKSKSIAYIEIVLSEDSRAPTGIVTGLITDMDDEPIAFADVILYRIGTDQSQTPVDYTLTNHEGIYVFINVSKGEYCINSNRSISVE